MEATIRAFNPRQVLAYLTLLASLAVAALAAGWLLQENAIERDNRIEMQINQHLMLGRGSEAYAFLREELQRGANLAPQWTSLLRFESDPHERFALLLAQLERTPARADLYRQIHRLLSDERSPVAEADRRRWLTQLNRLDNLNRGLLDKYRLLEP